MENLLVAALQAILALLAATRAPGTAQHFSEGPGNQSSGDSEDASSGEDTLRPTSPPC